jgi:hypothetical protein
MTHTFDELVIGGVLIAPIVTYAAIALVLIVALRPLLRAVRFTHWFSNSAIAELSLYVTVFGLLTLLF